MYLSCYFWTEEVDLHLLDLRQVPILWFIYTSIPQNTLYTSYLLPGIVGKTTPISKVGYLLLQDILEKRYPASMTGLIRMFLFHTYLLNIYLIICYEEIDQESEKVGIALWNRAHNIILEGDWQNCFQVECFVQIWRCLIYSCVLSEENHKTLFCKNN